MGAGDIQVEQQSDLMYMTHMDFGVQCECYAECVNQTQYIYYYEYLIYSVHHRRGLR